MNIPKSIGKTAKYTILLFSLVACILLFDLYLPFGENESGIGEIFFTRPALAQTTAFPADEAGISAYVNTGQNIDMAKAKNAMRGIQAEGENYVIGIIELPGLPEEEFPHMYVSSDGWILAYYSKNAPSSRIFQWYGYEGGLISTTTLKDAITSICPAVGVNYSQIGTNLKYYHFNFPQATTMVITTDITAYGSNGDSFEFLIPSSLMVYEGSWSLRGGRGCDNRMYLDGTQKGATQSFLWGTFEPQDIAPGKLRTVKFSGACGGIVGGVAVVFIH